MKYPEMIIFDYGHTLLYEPDWNSERGNNELLKYAVKNDNGCTTEDVKTLAEVVFGEHIEKVRNLGYDISGQVGNHFLYDYLGIEFSLSPLEMETVFWNGASVGAVMPNADKMLDYLNSRGIRTAVISNLLWSGEALKERLNRLLPNNRFEFVITSSDYLFRKPNILLFKLALRKSGLKADDIWFCGDDVENDIVGAHNAGFYPIWYSNLKIKCDYRDVTHEKSPEFEHLHICEWEEFIDILEKIRSDKNAEAKKCKYSEFV